MSEKENKENKDEHALADQVDGSTGGDNDSSDDNESKDFNMKDFMDDDSTFSGENPDDGSSSNSDSNDNSNDDSNDSGDDSNGDDSSDDGDDENLEMEWSPFTESDDNNDDNPSDDSDDSNDDNDDSNDDNNNSDLNTAVVDSTVISKFNELGINGKSIEEVYASIEGIVTEKKIYEDASYTNDNIKAWKNYLSLEDKELVFENYKAQGVSEDEAKKLVGNLEKNGTVANEAFSIRGAIRGSISRETGNIKAQEKEAASKRQANIEKVRGELKSHLDKTETMFGFKMAKKKDLEKVRANTFEYISSGKFADEVFATPESVVEAAWFHRNKEQIIKALSNKGSQTAKRELLDEIENPTIDSRVDYSDIKEGEFNPAAFSDVDEL